MEMTIQLVGAVYAKKESWQTEPTYAFHPNCCVQGDAEKSRLIWESHGYIYIAPVTLEVEELSDGEFQARQIKTLQVKKEALREAFLQESQRVDEQIEKLQCIEGPKEFLDDIPF